MAQYSRSKFPSFLGKAPRSSNFRFVANFHNSCCAHETSHLKLFPKPFALVPGDISYLSIFILSHSWQGPSPLCVLRFVLTCFHTLSYPFSPVSIDSSNLGHMLCRAWPEDLLHQIKASPCRSTLITMWCPPKCDVLHLPSLCLESYRHFGPPHVPLYFHVVAASSASHAPTCVCCHAPLRSMLLCFTSSVAKNQFFFWLRPKLFTIFWFLHQAVESYLHIAKLHKTHPVGAESWLLSPAPYLLRPATLPLVLAHLLSQGLQWWTFGRAALSCISLLERRAWRVRLPPVRLLDELCGTSPKSRSTSRRPSLLGQRTSFLLSTARQ